MRLSPHDGMTALIRDTRNLASPSALPCEETTKIEPSANKEVSSYQTPYLLAP